MIMVVIQLIFIVLLKYAKTTSNNYIPTGTSWFNNCIRGSLLALYCKLRHQV